MVPDGNTDPLIVKDIFIKANVDDQFRRRDLGNSSQPICASATTIIANGTTTIAPLPGAAELLQALSASEEFISSVVTGNFEATAEIKLEAAGLCALSVLAAPMRAIRIIVPTCRQSPKDAGKMAPDGR